LVDVGILATGVAESSRQAATQLSQRIERLFIERDLRQIQTQKLYHDLRVEDKVCFKWLHPILRFLFSDCRSAFVRRGYSAAHQGGQGQQDGRQDRMDLPVTKFIS
jgi:hypothetical protein